MKDIFSDDLTGGTCQFMQGLTWGGVDWFRVVSFNNPFARERSRSLMDSWEISCNNVNGCRTWMSRTLLIVFTTKWKRVVMCTRNTPGIEFVDSRTSSTPWDISAVMVDKVLTM